jgi:hypothetical protein
MADKNTQTLFDANAVPSTATTIVSPTNSPLVGGLNSGGLNMSQSEKDAILRQIHPIFLTTHSEEKTPVKESNFDKFLGFMRLSLEGLLKLVDIVVDAIIQVARLGVWIVAISGVLIVVTLMTNTTDKFIDLLNESVFKAFGWETRIAKVPTATEEPKTSTSTNLKSQGINVGEETPTNTIAPTTATAPTTTTRRKRTISPDLPTAENTSTDTPESPSI